ncbi:MAG: class I SAM-dependent RNA methyltransferase [Treponema sp.]|nr:class I SAM-dependent RNA methyltransferase [Treponema sp.]
MEIITEKITFGGNSLGKINGKNTFVPFSLPGEKLEVEITDTKKDYDTARIVKVIEASPYRIEAPCPYYGTCGGCNMMHIKPDFQRKLRRSILCDVFMHNGIDISSEVFILHGPDYGYRARFQLTDGGLSQKNSNEIIQISKCLCAEKNINDYLEQTSPEKREKGRCHLFGSSFMTQPDDAGIVISKEVEKKQNPVIDRKKIKHKPKENHYFSGTLYSPENSITVNLNGKDISFDVRGFFQSNLYVFSKVLELLKQELPGGKNILDMYSGCGSISAFLADKYENVVMVEHNRDAIVYAEENLSGKKHISYGMSGAAWVKNCAAYCPSFDACLVDPPRSGMEKEVCDYLCNSKIPLIFSLSCDPATHARDCARLIKAGYMMKRIYLLDFYPNTSHIESLAVFEKGIR